MGKCFRRDSRLPNGLGVGKLQSAFVGLVLIRGKESYTSCHGWLCEEMGLLFDCTEGARSVEADVVSSYCVWTVAFLPEMVSHCARHVQYRKNRSCTTVTSFESKALRRWL